MVILKRAKGDTSGVKGGLRSIFGALKDESIEAFKETGKEIIKGVTMLPRDLIAGAQPGNGEKGKSWEDEWLKDKDKNKPPVSEKEGEHSKIDPGKRKGTTKATTTAGGGSTAGTGLSYAEKGDI